MKIKKLLILAMFLSLSPLEAQEALTASGGSASGTNGNVSYSVGQTVYTTSTGTTGSVSQGVQQPFEIQTVLGVENFNINLQLAVYPNPTSNWLQLEVKNTNFTELSCQLIDLNGRVINNQKVTTEITNINTEQLHSAIYLLEIYDNSKKVKTFKIIKR